jgi:integrase
MKELYDYTQSERYTKRLFKYKAWCKEQIENGNTSLFEGDDAINPEINYLFLTQTGKPMVLRVQDFTGRWIEVRNTANHSQSLGLQITGSLHNLRATFAVNIFRHLLKKMDPDDALDRVSSLLGHEDREITLEYLKIAQDMPMGDEIYEDVLDYIGAFDDVKESKYGS